MYTEGYMDISVKEFMSLKDKKGFYVVTEYDDNKFYYKDNKLHRVDGPAIIYNNGSKYYYKEDERHRLDGPAVIHADGSKEYYLNDEKLSKEGFVKELYKEPLKAFLLNPENF